MLVDFGETLKVVGPGMISQRFSKPLNSGTSLHVDGLALIILQILQQEHACQTVQDAEDASQEDDQAEQDAYVISSAADAMCCLAFALGPAFNGYFRNFLPLISKWYKPTKPAVDRNMAVGALAEVSSCLGENVSEFTDNLLPIFIKGLSDDDEEVKSNSAYGIGILCANPSTNLSRYFISLILAYICRSCSFCIHFSIAQTQKSTLSTMHAVAWQG